MARSASEISADLTSAREALRACYRMRSYSKNGQNVQRQEMSALRQEICLLERELATANGIPAGGIFGQAQVVL